MTTLETIKSNPIFSILISIFFLTLFISGWNVQQESMIRLAPCAVKNISFPPMAVSFPQDSKWAVSLTALSKDKVTVCAWNPDRTWQEVPKQEVKK